jgi:hypothetical protein
MRYGYKGSKIPMLLTPFSSSIPLPTALLRQKSGSIIAQQSPFLNQAVRLPEQPPQWKQVRMKDKQSPLTVALQAEGLPKAVLQNALSAWEKATEGQVNFHLLQKATPAIAQRADILILWANETLAKTTTAGKAWLHIKTLNASPLIVGSTIELVKAPLIDAYISTHQQKDRLYTTLLHELGHALGLNHAQNAASVMHPAGWKNRHLTSEDSNLFFQLYPKRV